MSAHHVDWKDADWKDPNWEDADWKAAEWQGQVADWKEESWKPWRGDSWHGTRGDRSEKSHGWGAESARSAGSGWKAQSHEMHEHDWYSQGWSSTWAASPASHRSEHHAGMSTSPQVREADTPEITATSTVVPCAGSDRGKCADCV